MTVDAAAVRRAASAVEDPGYQGFTIAELGILDAVRVDAAKSSVEIDLLPTRMGCPALEMIGRDVVAAVRAVEGVREASVHWRLDPPWTPARVTIAARTRLAGEHAVTIRRRDGSIRCPICGSAGVVDVSEVGPTPCRSIARCDACRNPVEVLRT